MGFNSGFKGLKTTAPKQVLFSPVFSDHHSCK